MKKTLKIICIIIGIIIILGLIFFIIDYNKLKNNVEKELNEIKMKEQLENNDNMKSTLRAVVVKVYEKSLLVMETKDTNELCSVGFTEEGNIGYKKGQEVLIYFDGIIMTTYPGQIGNVGKIEIVKDESDIQIPDKILRYAYSSRNNVNINISELTNKGITFTITDTNELPYNYSNEYIIYKKVKEEKNINDNKKIVESNANLITDNSVNYIQENTGTNIGYIWKEAEKISNISSKDTGEILVYNLPNQKENEHYMITGRKFDWTPLYGELKSGEYEFVLLMEDDSFSIRINFTINENGELTYNQPNISI